MQRDKRAVREGGSWSQTLWGNHCCPLCRSRWNKESSLLLRTSGESSSATFPACITRTRSESKMVFSLARANATGDWGSLGIGRSTKYCSLMEHPFLWSPSAHLLGHLADYLSRDCSVITTETVVSGEEQHVAKVTLCNGIGKKKRGNVSSRGGKGTISHDTWVSFLALPPAGFPNLSELFSFILNVPFLNGEIRLSPPPTGDGRLNPSTSIVFW